LIRDTDVAEGTVVPEQPGKKEPDPLLSLQNLNIGNFYYKRKNYDAAIQRYLEALEYQPDSVEVYEALTRAYEKKGDRTSAIKTYREFIEKYPDSPKSPQFREKLARLEEGL